MSETIYDPKTFVPWNSVGFLIGHTRRALLEAMDRELAQLDITAAQYITLSSLSRKRAATAAELCSGMIYDPGAMTRQLDRLEEKGLVRRTRLPGDRRRITLELTPAGEALCPTMNAAVVRVLNQHLSGLNKREVHELERLLRRILANAGEDLKLLTEDSHG